MSMLSEQSKRSIAAVFQKAAGVCLVRTPGDMCNIVPTEDRDSGAQLSDELLLITISSFVFRLLTIFQVAESPATRAYFVSGAADRTLHDGFSEFANLCCGAMNRELSLHGPQLAMSIPYTLSRHCMTFLEALKPQYLASYAITINDSVQLQVTLCLCCHTPVDFPVSTDAVEHGGGELEMF
jgi:hypothetical protein